MIVNDEFIEFYVLMCSTISKPVRLKIIHTLGKKKMNVTSLQKELKIPMSNLSNHLNDLYRSGVLTKEKQGNFAYYSLSEPDLINGISRMQKIFQSITAKRTISE